MRKILICSACGTELSGVLTILSTKDPAVTEPCHVDGEPLGPAGTAYKSWKPLAEAMAGPPVPLQFTPQYWLHPDDVAGRVQDTKQGVRLSGCCGLAGLNGPNQLCACGAEVGTLINDCWTAHIFVPEPDATDWRDG